MNAKFEMVFTKEEIERIEDKISNNGKHEITVDLHQLTVKEAERLVKNLIVINRDECRLNVIHGYNRGTALKTMITTDNISPRIRNRISCKDNPGRTILDVVAA